MQHNVQNEGGGGAKGFLNNVQKTADLVEGGTPKGYSWHYSAVFQNFHESRSFNQVSLEIAVVQTWKKISFQAALLKYSCPVTNRGKTPVKNISQGGEEIFIIFEKIYTPAGININATDQKGGTPLHSAAWHGIISQKCFF